MLLNGYLDSETLNKTYIYTGPGGRISNTYVQLSNKTFIELDDDNQGSYLYFTKKLFT